jgi:uracil-DNA glycosylase family 4
VAVAFFFEEAFFFDAFFLVADFFFDFGQPRSISSYDSFAIVERFFERLVPAFLRLLMFATSDVFLAAMRRSSRMRRGRESGNGPLESAAVAVALARRSPSLGDLSPSSNGGEAPSSSRRRTSRVAIRTCTGDALVNAGLVRAELYVTNAVKHFKWEPRGKRRIHARPNAQEVNACQGWLAAELALVKSEAIVCLGATAAQALLGRAFKVTLRRGERLDGAPWAGTIVATHHPSAVLRMEGGAWEEALGELVADLGAVRREGEREAREPGTGDRGPGTGD